MQGFPKLDVIPKILGTCPMTMTGWWSDVKKEMLARADNGPEPCYSSRHWIWKQVLCGDDILWYIIVYRFIDLWESHFLITAGMYLKKEYWRYDEIWYPVSFWYVWLVLYLIPIYKYIIWIYIICIYIICIHIYTYIYMYIYIQYISQYTPLYTNRW